MGRKPKVTVTDFYSWMQAQSAANKTVTIPRIMRHFHLTYQEVMSLFNRTRRALRGHAVNLVGEPLGHRKPWRFWLTGLLGEARWWLANRILDLETRIVTILAVSESIVKGTDARTIEGRKARLMVKHLQRLTEDLAEVKEEVR
jgi:hypothetical protein